MTTEITWHPYPQEKPQEEGISSAKQFLCIDDDGIYHIYHRRQSWVDDGVVMWAELPKPYEGEVKA